MKRVTVYYVPTCAFSTGAIAFLVARGADVLLINLDQHPDVREDLTRHLQGAKLETPVFDVEGQIHVAPSLSSLKKMLAEWGLPDEAAPHDELKKRRADEEWNRVEGFQ